MITSPEEQTLQSTAVLRGEQNGVRWYTRHEYSNQIHTFILPSGKVFEGPYVSGRYVFTQLTTLAGEERDVFLRRLRA